ncbi:MAG: FAD:protein FMN transferase [Bacteroidetes bacterium]|nr:FAD:protein FMN transferase [Bacteroidota bacterium]
MAHVAHTSFYAMGTRCNIVLPGFDDDAADAVFRHVQNEIARIEGKLSRFHDGSDIFSINKYAVSQPVETDNEIFEVINSCCRYHQITQGYFDITLRPILEYWKEHPQAEKNEIDEILARTGTSNIELNPENRVISFKNEHLDIDLGGFGKGYALEKVHQMLTRFGIKSAFITMGESSVLTVGHHPAGDHWKVGIKNYLNADEAVHTFQMRDGSVSTSSNFYPDDDGTLINHRHVINPQTGYPIDELVSATVYSHSARDAEALSTAILAMPEEHIQQLVNHFSDIVVLKVDYTDNQINKKVWEYEATSVSH